MSDAPAMVAALQSYRSKLLLSGQLLEARAVAYCIKLIRKLSKA